MGMHDGHRDRLRERFIKEGLDGFEEHTALELLLFYARPRCNTNEIAHALMKRFGGFAQVLDAPIEELMKVEGMGKQSAVLIKMVPELGAFYLKSKNASGKTILSTQEAGQLFLPIFFGKQTEMVYMVALDDKRKVLRCVCLSESGIVNAVSISVKQIVTEAVNANATGVILAHNHPGGLALPSLSDKAVTHQAFQALRLINVTLLDHIIVADGDFVSMADSGYMETLGHSEM